MPKSLQSNRALAHPLWWVALAVLLANDHLFKGSGVLPQPVIGKVSDIAGLFLVGPLLAAVLRVQTKRGWALAHVVPGAIFAAINLSPTLAGGFESLMAITPFPWSIYVDPTDLVALPMLALSHLVFFKWCQTPQSARRMTQTLGLALGGIACAATSPPPEEVPLIFPGEFDDIEARLPLGNDTNRQIIVRVRSLRPKVTVNCTAAIDVGPALARDLFGPARAWIVEPGRVIDMEEGHPVQDCGIYLIDAPELSPRIIMQPVGGQGRFSGQAADLYGTQAVVISESESGLKMESALSLHRVAQQLDEPSTECAVPDLGTGLEWDEVPIGTFTLTGRTVSPDGCHAFNLQGRQNSFRWYVCTGIEVQLPFSDGDELTIESSYPRGDTERVEIAGPTGKVSLSRGREIPGIETEGRIDRGCGLQRDACDGVLVPFNMSFIEDEESIALRLGESVSINPTTKLTLVRAQRQEVTDHACHTQSYQNGDLIEAIVIETYEGGE